MKLKIGAKEKHKYIYAMPKNVFLFKSLILSLAILEANSESNKAKQLTVNYLQVKESDPKFFFLPNTS